MNYVRIGLLILVLHDCADIYLPLAKALRGWHRSRHLERRPRHAQVPLAEPVRDAPHPEPSAPPAPLDPPRAIPLALPVSLNQAPN